VPRDLTVCAVLAGGASLRFGGGKLAWRGLGGIPLLSRVVRALEESGVCRSIVVVASPLTSREVEGILGDAYDVARDPGWLPCSGPLRGLAAAAMAARGSSVQLAAGDMAWLSPGAVAGLVEAARSHGATAAAPMWSTGYVQTLAGYIRDPELALEACLRRGVLGRPSDVYRGAPRLLLVGSALLGDRDGRTFMSVNTPEEALNPSPDPPGQRLVDASRATRFYREATRLDAALGSVSAYTLYYLEAAEYSRLGATHFARHAWQDYCDALRRQGHREDPRGPLPACRGRTKHG
jgi:molybdopterin-guanine dinucleotide biosynthesis protein A